MIYILEDDDSIRKLVTYALESQGYAATGFALPSAFYKAMEDGAPSLLLLDIMLPEEDGISILRKLRADPLTAHLPVIMLTAKSTEYDHVAGLDAGADDYVAKPFGMMELLARVRAVLRRAEARGNTESRNIYAADSRSTSPSEAADTEKGPAAHSAGKPAATAGGVSATSALPFSAEDAGAEPSTGRAGRSADAAAGSKNDVLQFGILRIYPKRYEVFVEDTEVSLTHKEYQLLLLLAENEGIVLTREILLDRIWDLGSEPENRTLDVHIRKIRSKLGGTAAWIETIRGVGYRFRPT
jgi:two-component system alkaline phosphatase synthesis response regulator PhoP